MARMVEILGGILIWISYGYAYASVDPTAGFCLKPLNSANLEIQRPYDKEVAERYSFVDAVHKLWVYRDDKPHTLVSKTHARTEILIRVYGYDYTTGVWQFEGDLYVLLGTWGACVMQVFGGVEHATSLMLTVNDEDGKLRRYNEEVVESCVYDRWIHLNVIHDADEGKVYVFVDGEQKLIAQHRGRADHYFKCGVYSGANSSYYMESRWKNIRLWVK